MLKRALIDGSRCLVMVQFLKCCKDCLILAHLLFITQDDMLIMLMGELSYFASMYKDLMTWKFR